VVQPNELECPDPIIINEAQLILAEKRTALAAMRTGIAVFALPLSVLSLLIVTSKSTLPVKTIATEQKPSCRRRL
jgi:uncharacterized membrane protein YkgB